MFEKILRFIFFFVSVSKLASFSSDVWQNVKRKVKRKSLKNQLLFLLRLNLTQCEKNCQKYDTNLSWKSQFSPHTVKRKINMKERSNKR